MLGILKYTEVTGYYGIPVTFPHLNTLQKVENLPSYRVTQAFVITPIVSIVSQLLNKKKCIDLLMHELFTFQYNHFAHFTFHFSAEWSHATNILEKSCKVEKLQSEKCKLRRHEIGPWYSLSPLGVRVAGCFTCFVRFSTLLHKLWIRNWSWLIDRQGGEHFTNISSIFIHFFAIKD